MNRNRTSIALLGLLGSILAGLPRGMREHMMPSYPYPPAKASRNRADSDRLLAAAQAKRDRRCARNLALLRADEQRSSAA